MLSHTALNLARLEFANLDSRPTASASYGLANYLLCSSIAEIKNVGYKSIKLGREPINK